MEIKIRWYKLFYNGLVSCEFFSFQAMKMAKRVYDDLIYYSSLYNDLMADEGNVNDLTDYIVFPSAIDVRLEMVEKNKLLVKNYIDSCFDEEKNDFFYYYWELVKNNPEIDANKDI